MARFVYKATTADGEIREGHIDADDREAGVRSLQAQGQIPIRLELVTAAGSGGLDPSIAAAPLDAVRERRRTRRIDFAQTSAFTLELATLLGAGLPVERALRALSEVSETENMSELIEALRTAVRAGTDLSVAMAGHPEVFNRLYVSMVRAGEESGALAQTLDRLVAFQERARELRQSLAASLYYPAILVAFAVASILVIVNVVIPKFAALFDDAGAELPAITRLVVDSATFMQNHWLILFAAAVALIVLIRAQLSQPGPRLVFDRLILSFPLVGVILQRVETARFCRTLGTLLHNGVTLNNALSIAREVVGNRCMAESLLEVRARLRAGEGFTGPMSESGLWPPIAMHMLRVGEESGELSRLLMRVADTFDREVDASLKRFIAIFEPLIILLLGLVIAIIILSVLAAILSVNKFAI